MKKRKYCKKGVFVLLVVLILNTLTYAGIIYDFHIFNNSQYENDPRLNFSLTISDEGLTATGKQKIGFKFENNSTVRSSITDIYFDARPDTGSSLIFGNVSIAEGPGVSFSKYANPISLPGGAGLIPKFDKYPEYSADSDSPVSLNGINPDEWLKLVFTLKYDRTIDDVVSEIAAGGSSTENSLRVGIHIQSLPKEIHHSCCCCPPSNCYGSASAINGTQIQQIPEPATIFLLGFGALSLVYRKNNKKSR